MRRLFGVGQYAIPDNQPPWWNRMMEDMSAEISDMTAKLCVIPNQYISDYWQIQDQCAAIRKWQ